MIMELGGQRTDYLSEHCRAEMEHCLSSLATSHPNISFYQADSNYYSSEIFGIEWYLSKLPWWLMGSVVWRFPLFLRLVSSAVFPFQ